MASNTEYSTKGLLHLACAAYRVNGKYISDRSAYEDSTLVSNRDLILYSLGEKEWFGPTQDRPPLLHVTQEDKDLAEKVLAYSKKLLFSVINGTNQFEINLHKSLSTDTSTISKLGFIACSPNSYIKHATTRTLTKSIRDCEDEYIGEIGSQLYDRDSEIVSVTKSTNYDAFNVIAVVENKMVSWMTSKIPNTGPAVIISANIKDFSTLYKHGTKVTRLNYVKVAQ